MFGIGFNNFGNHSIPFRGMTPQQMEATEMAVYQAQEDKQIADAYGAALKAQKEQNGKDGPQLANLAERLNNIHERYQADANLMSAQRNLMSATKSLNYYA